MPRTVLDAMTAAAEVDDRGLRSPVAVARNAYLDTLAFLKRPALWFELIHRHRGTITFAPPFAYALALRRIPCSEVTRWDLSCLRVAGCGAEPIAGRTLRAFSTHFEAAGLPPEALCPSYGLAEANASGHLHARG